MLGFVDMSQKYCCVRKQFCLFLVLYEKTPYLCIVKQDKRITLKVKIKD